MANGQYPANGGNRGAYVGTYGFKRIGKRTKNGEAVAQAFKARMAGSPNNRLREEEIWLV
jgi:hypothetical protein